MLDVDVVSKYMVYMVYNCVYYCMCIYTYLGTTRELPPRTKSRLEVLEYLSTTYRNSTVVLYVYVYMY
jgi:hypothetical protein